MANPREQIESMMLAALANLIPSNGYDIPQAIRTLTRKHRDISQVPDDERPQIVLLTEFEGQGPIELGPNSEHEGSLSFAVLIYTTVPTNQEGATYMNRYTGAIEQCLRASQFWDNLAEMTEVQGIPTHNLLALPDAISTVNGRITYLYTV